VAILAILAVARKESTTMEEAYDVAVEALALARQLPPPYFKQEPWKQLLEALELLVSLLAP
jgi:hypothetical protein